MDGVDWITALKTGAIAKLADGGHLQLDLFDERNLISQVHPDYPGERLVACSNPALTSRRARKSAPTALAKAHSRTLPDPPRFQPIEATGKSSVVAGELPVSAA